MKKISVLLALNFVITLVLFVVDISVGTELYSLANIISVLTGNSQDNLLNIIFFDFRLPRVLSAILTGSALAVSGQLMQSIFRNPLAGPYVLGISSGASLGVAILILALPLFSLGAWQINDWAIVIAACGGAFVVLMVILFVSLRLHDILTILILGIMFGAATSSLINILQFFSSNANLKVFVVWTMGSLTGVSKSQLNILFLFVIVGIFISLGLSKTLNVLWLGEDNAQMLGIRIKRSRILVFTATGLLAGSVTAFCGPIGFVGIAVPHITRMLFSTVNHNILIPANILTGASALLLSDIIAQLPGSQKILPINSVTALIGVPIIIWILLNNRR